MNFPCTLIASFLVILFAGLNESAQSSEDALAAPSYSNVNLNKSAEMDMPKNERSAVVNPIGHSRLRRHPFGSAGGGGSHSAENGQGGGGWM
jgi:hypothetical protein